MTQLNLSEWLVIAEKSEMSHIKRFPYKLYMGCSLTQEILKHKLNDRSSTEAFGLILKQEGIQMMLYDFPDWAEKIKENIWVSICARYSETDTQDKMRDKIDNQ